MSKLSANKHLKNFPSDDKTPDLSPQPLIRVRTDDLEIKVKLDMSKYRQKINMNKEENAVLIIYDQSDNTFYRTAQLYQTKYENHAEEIIFEPSSDSVILSFMNKYAKRNMIIHYVGHGSSSVDDKFPSICNYNLQYDVIPMIKDWFGVVVNQYNFIPNLTIFLDCCNPLGYAEPRQQMFNPLGVTLIFQLKGLNIISSSRKGESSWFVSGRHTLFYDAFEKSVDGVSSDFSMILVRLERALQALYLKAEIPFKDTVTNVWLHDPDLADRFKSQFRISSLKRTSSRGETSPKSTDMIDTLK